MSDDVKIKMLSKFIKNFFDKRPAYKGWYNQFDEVTIDFVMKYKLTKLSIKQDKNSDCLYNCEAEVKFYDMQVFDPEYEEWITMNYTDDFPQYLFDELNEDILVDFEKLMPDICLVINFID